ncbi:hypothetical protein VTH82DRAFT_4339 [Thermothelomyces myriococcoides]
MAPSATGDTVSSRREAWKNLPPPTLYPVKEARFEKYLPPQIDGRERALAQPEGQAAIVIDNGSSTVRAGWSFETKPRLAIPPIMSKYRDRKAGKTFSFAGYDCYADTAARGHIRHAFEAGTGIVSNWDVMEHVLDHVFIKLGMNGVEGGIDMPIVMTEARVASTAQHHAAHRPFVRHLSATTAPRSSMTSGSTRDDNSSNAQQPKFTAHSDPEALETFLSPLLVTNGGRWTLAMEGQALEREFKFKTFAKTWCKLKNHHPEWSNVYNTTFIRWTTHHPKGLSEKDIELATICDKLATDFGEVVPEQQEQQQLQPREACSLSGLANRALGTGDCCNLKTK